MRRQNTKKSQAATDDPDDASVFTDGTVDTDLEQDDPTNHDVRYTISSQSGSLCSLNKFLDDGKMLNGNGDPSTNIIDRQRGKPYNIPPQKINKFFACLEKCRRDKNVPMMICEKQQTYSGLMLDFDIYQDTEKNQLADDLFGILAQSVIEWLRKLLTFKEKKDVIYCGVTRRPSITYSDPKSCYKDGFHMIFPGVKITKGAKVWLIRKLISQEVIDQVFTDVKPANIKIHSRAYRREDFLDSMSASVPTFFVGSSTKKGSRPYRLDHVYKISVNHETGTVYPSYDNSFLQNSRINVCHEFSLNWEAPDGIIKKTNYDVKESLAAEVDKIFEHVRAKEEIATRNFGELSTQAIHDVRIGEIKQLLDMLKPFRAESYKEWRNVLCALANTSTSYKDLAQYFSAKSAKFKLADFEIVWRQIVGSPQSSDRPLTLGSLHFWAKNDNANRYEEFRKTTVYNILYKMVHERYKEGILNHADVAQLLYVLLQFKYKTDTPDGQKLKVWYEFILDDDQHIDGEIYKWRCWDGKLPTSISLYISERLPRLFEKVLDAIAQNYDKAVEPNLIKYHSKVLQNFKKTVNQLGNRNFKKNVILEAEDKFAEIGFAKRLDTDPLVRGVANGVLKLSLVPGCGPKLIQGYHSHLISKYTEVPYIAFNPRDPMTKKIIMTIRNLFPDNEPDSHDFTMKYLASTIDGNPKESMFMIMTGSGSNGKSSLVELHKGAIGGHYGVKMPIEYLTSRSKSADAATPAVMMLKDASLAYYSESNKHDVLNEARIKEVTGQETLAGRKLHQDIINFKPRCHHLCTSNFEFDIQCNDHGIWRRICRNPLKIRFVNVDAGEIYDPNDIYQRPADLTVTDTWTNDPEVLGRYLGYMVMHHKELYTRYRGKVKNVPHPHIQFETESYRNKQNIVEKFISEKLVKVKDVPNENDTLKPQEFSMSDQVAIYAAWYQQTSGDRMPIKGIVDMFKNSSIGKFIHNKARGSVLVGFRFLKQNEQPGEDEEYAQKHVFQLALPDDNFGIASETAEQYYEKVCAQYDANAHLFDENAVYDVDVSTANYNALGDTAYDKQYLGGEIDLSSVPEQTSRRDNVEFNGRILSNGIRIIELEEPSVNPTADGYAGELSGFLPSIVCDADE